MGTLLKTFKVGYFKKVGFNLHGSRTVKARDADEAKARVRHLIDGACNVYIQWPQVLAGPSELD